MRPKKRLTTGSNDLFRARLDQIINLKHELAQLAGRIDWEWIDREIAPLYSEPGDIVVERENFRFYFPLMTSIVISVLLSLLLWLVGR